MSPEDFTDLGTLIASDLSKYGLEVEVKMAFQ
jgi:hypothetical protein